MWLIFIGLKPHTEIAVKKLGLHIKMVRRSKGLTQIEVSSAMHRDQQSLQRVESGRVNPSYTYLLELAAALNIELEELIKDAQSITYPEK